MASLERPGATVDAASTAPTPRDDRLARLAMRVGRCAFAYLAFEIAIVLVSTALVLTPSKGDYGGATAFFFAMLSFPFAWLPLSLVLHLALKARILPMGACLLAGTIAGVALALLLAIFAVRLSTISMETKLPETFSWRAVGGQFLESLRILAPGGVTGGLVFWAVYFWLPTRFGVATAPTREA